MRRTLILTTLAICCGMLALPFALAQPPRGGPGGPGGPGGRGPGGFGGPGAPGGFPGMGQPGQVLPPFLQETLKLTDEQKQMVAELQKEVDARLEKILTADQKSQLEQLRQRPGPGFPGGPGGGPGGPGRGPGRD